VTRREAVESALLNRHSDKYALIEPARQYRSYTLLELAREVLTWSGANPAMLDKHQIAQRALHSTSDFPELLANVANKTLRDGYQSAPQTFTPFVRFVSLADFKQVSRIALGEAPALAEVKEGGEYKRGTIGEAAEKYQLKTYGKIFAVTRQTIINDDLDAFTRIPKMFGVQASNLESDLVWAIITDNDDMSDNVDLFHATHANYTGSGTAISIDSLTVGRLAMRSQTGIDGVTILNLSPRYLVVPAAKETVAQQYCAINIPQNAVDATKWNPFGGTLIPVAEPRLDANSAASWYLFCDASQIDMIEVGTLDGMRGPRIETRNGFDIDGTEIKASYDIAAKAIDFRGMYKNVGA